MVESLKGSTEPKEAPKAKLLTDEDIDALIAEQETADADEEE